MGIGLAQFNVRVLQNRSLGFPRPVNDAVRQLREFIGCEDLDLLVDFLRAPDGGGVNRSSVKIPGLLAELDQRVDRKPIVAIDESTHGMKRTLGAGDLVMLAIGAVIGAGIFSSLGTAAAGEMRNGELVRLDAEYTYDTLPTGVNSSTSYFIINSTSNTFKVSLTSGGSAVDITVDGTATVRRYGNTTVAIAIDTVAATAIGSASAQADLIASETTAPTAVGSFSSPTTKAAGLALSSLTFGQCRAVWVKRTALNNGARNVDGVVVKVEGDTAA